jgi:biopolymer transport protein ExbD
MRKGFTGKRSRSWMHEDTSLQITSMADVFMILLVFLLKTYSTGVSPIDPPANMKLPVAGKTEKIEEALKVEISDSSIRVDGKPVASLKNYQFRNEDQDSAGLVNSLKRSLASQEKSQTSHGKLMVLADQRTPYSTLKAVLNTAALTGWREYKLVVVEDR